MKKPFWLMIRANYSGKYTSGEKSSLAFLSITSYSTNPHFVRAPYLINFLLFTMNVEPIFSVYFADIALLISGSSLAEVYAAYREYIAGR